MTKADLIEKIYQSCAPTRQDSAELVEMTFDIMKETLEKGEDVMISGFGKFVVRDKKQRMGRNPQTGEEMMISARRVLSFKPSPGFRDKVNAP